MPKAALVDSQDFSRESKSNAAPSIEAYGSANTTENEKRYGCSSWMYDYRWQTLRRLLCQDLKAALAHIEDYRLGARFRLVGQSDGKSAKGTFQLDQTHGEFNIHRVIQPRLTLNPILPIPALTRRVTLGENAGFLAASCRNGLVFLMVIQKIALSSV